MSITLAYEQILREETVRLLRLGLYTVKNRMKKTGLELGATVTDAIFTSDGALSVATGPQSILLADPYIEFGITRIRFWIYEGKARKTIVELEAIIDDHFAHEVNASLDRLDMPPWQSDETIEYQKLQFAAEPLATKLIGKTISGVHALDTDVSGYAFLCTDGTIVTLRAYIRDYDVAVLHVDDEGPDN